MRRGSYGGQDRRVMSEVVINILIQEDSRGLAALTQ
jgi:hypothetical protein